MGARTFHSFVAWMLCKQEAMSHIHTHIYVSLCLVETGLKVEIAVFIFFISTGGTQTRLVYRTKKHSEKLPEIFAPDAWKQIMQTFFYQMCK